MDQSDITFFAGQAKRCFDLASTCGDRTVADALSQMARYYLAAARSLNPDSELLVSDKALSQS
jgi:hypothetical protein